jgi:penicillin amidase
MRLIGRTLLVLLLAAVCIAAGGLFYLWTSLPQTAGEIRLAGIDGPVEVTRGRFGLVRIRGASQRDDYFALGFVHAQDRLVQMELQRRLAQGRLAEVIGPAGLESDRFMRTLGIYRLAQEIVPTLKPDTLEILKAYADGINAYLKSASSTPPPEFVLLRHHPEPWTPADSVVWGKLMSLQLSGNFRSEALRARMRDRLPQELIDALWPPMGGPTTTEGASNAWIIGGDRTSTRKPILANDPHLALRVPGVWHLSRLDAPGFTIAGAAFPGTPFHILGHNGHVAWGMTTTNADVSDLVVERVLPNQPDHYETPEGPAPLAVREERILVRGGSPVALKVRATRHGPVVSDVLPAVAAAASGDLVALQATWLMPGDHTADALQAMARAPDAAAFRAALQDFDGPVQNIHYADTAGAFGMVTAGHIPIRDDGDGWMPAAGWRAHQRWSSFIPFDRLPQRTGKPYETIANANNRVVGDDYPYFITREWDSAYRARRLEALLNEPGRQRPDTSAAIMADTMSLSARDLLPILAPMVPPGGRAAAALRLLGAWDGKMDRERPEPLIFTAWVRELVRGIFADELGDLFEEFWDLRPALLHHVLAEDPSWCDDRATADRLESCADEAREALEHALSFLSERYGPDMASWQWGKAHEVVFTPPYLGGVPLLGRLFTVALPADGGYDTLNRGQMRIADGETPFRDVHGAGFRGIFDLSNLDASRFMIAVGQSGNPLSPHYFDLALPWRDFTWVSLPPPGTPVPEARTLRLVPR